jgi:hypothetical protein
MTPFFLPDEKKLVGVRVAMGIKISCDYLNAQGASGSPSRFVVPESGGGD